MYHAMKTKLVAAACVVVALQASASAQGGWTPIASGPQARYGHAMAFDSLRGRTILFGGNTGNALLADTWEWDGTTWTQVASSGPAPRFGHGMAYDSLRGKVVTAGGETFTPTGSGTWEWDGVSWSSLTSSGPTGRDVAMTYDLLRDRIVVVQAITNGHTLPITTYEWDRTSWRSIGSSGPIGLPGPALAYDSKRGKTVMFGGASYLNGMVNTWEWDGATWAPASGPSRRAYSAMVYDSTRSKITLVAGYTTGSSYSDFFEWDGYHWAQLTANGPSSRGWHAMAYDSNRGTTVLFGGQSYGGIIGDAWEWRSEPGHASAFGNGCGSPPLLISPDRAAPPNISATAQATLTNIPASTAFVALGWSRTSVGPFSLPFPLAGYGMPSCYMLQSAVAAAQPVTQISPGTAAFSLSIPNWSGLIGLNLYLQGWAVAPGENSGNTIVSNGLEWRIGY